MNTAFLQSFVTVVEHGSIAEAARRLNLPAAALAHGIDPLKGGTGPRLLSRSGQKVQPTQAGAAILLPARDLLGRVRDLRSIAANDTPLGKLRLGAVQTAKSGLLPRILSVMTKSYPQIEIQ